MTESSPDQKTHPGDELLAELADEFVRRYRAGEQPSVDEYAEGHPELADRIRELFPAVILMEQPAFGATLDIGPLTERVGATIGRYKLLEQIGEGGMGVVFMAEQQEPVRRKVALKVIKPGMDTRQVIARFEAERQALAVMDHPSIARVLDAGSTQSGHPYFVMELVRGVPITTYCDENNLSVRERLELFASVCQAIQHAHTKGIIHRDIKPTNVLVTRQDGRAVVKVIDFGVAKAMGQQLTEKTLFTNFAQMIGTPLYMSPEQAEQSGVDIDTRSDIYSLGVLLYELLTGSTPVDAEQLKQAAFDEIRRIIREDEPQTPSARISGSNTLPAIAAHRHTEPARLSKLVRGELDWIVMKALEKDRNRRYETANAFATDLLHYLNDEHVQACPPSARYRFGKFARRNRVAFATVALVATSLVLGTAASTWQAIRATRAEGLAESHLIAETRARTEADSARAAEAEQRRLAEAERVKAESERVKAEKQRAAAEANLQRAKETVEKYFTLISESTLLDVPGLQPLRQELIESALEFYEKLAAERPEDAALLVDLAATYLRLAIFYHFSDRTDDSVAAANEALDIISRLERHPEAAEYERKLAGYFAGNYFITGTMGGKMRDPVRVLQTLRRLEAAWQRLADKYPSDPGFQVNRAVTAGLMAAFFSYAGQPTMRDNYRRKAIAIMDRLSRESPTVHQYRAGLAELSVGLGKDLVWSGNAEEGLSVIRRAVQLADALVREHPDIPGYRRTLAESLWRLGNNVDEPQEAEALNRRAVEIVESLVRDHPGALAYHELQCRALQDFVIALANAGKLNEVEAIGRRLVAVSEPLIAQFPQHPWFRNDPHWGLLAVATALAASGREEEANRAFDQAIEKAMAVDHDPTGTLNKFAWGLVKRRNVVPAAAAVAVQAALRACELQPRWASYRNTLGVAQYRKGDYAAAIESLGRSRALDGNRSSLPAVDGYFLAMAHAKLGHAEQAENWLRVADLWMALFHASNEDLKRYRAEAIDVVGVEAEPMRSKSATPETEQELLRLCVAADPKAAWMHHWLGLRLANRGAWSEADKQLTQASASLFENAEALACYAMVRLRLGDLDGYRQACVSMCEQFRNAKGPPDSHWLAWTCGLVPDAYPDMTVALAQSEKCDCWRELLLFRCGRYEDAAARLKGKVAAPQTETSSIYNKVYPRVLLAMTHWQLGQKDEARQRLSEARSGCEQKSLAKLSWDSRATVELLLAEAEQMIASGD